MNWLLTDEEIWATQQGNCEWDDADKGRAVAKAQAKKLMEYLEENTMLNHMRTRDELSCMESCDVCKLLKEVGLE